MTFLEQRVLSIPGDEHVLGASCKHAASVAGRMTRRRLETGRVYTYLPDDVTPDILKEFSIGGAVSRSKKRTASVPAQRAAGRSWQPVSRKSFYVVSRIMDSLREGPDRICIFEDSTALKGDVYLKKAKARIIAHDSEVYYCVPVGDATPEQIEEAYCSADSWRLVGAVTRRPPAQLNEPGFAREDIEAMARSVSLLIVGAYDGEGALIWEADAR